MADPGESIGRPLERPRELKEPELILDVAVAQHQRGNGALGIVGRMLEVDQFPGSIEGIVNVEPPSLGYLGGGIDPGGRSFGAAKRRACQRSKLDLQRRRDVGRHQGGKEGRLLQFVDAVLRGIHQLRNRRAGVHPAHGCAGVNGNPICLLLDAFCPHAMEGS